MPQPLHSQFGRTTQKRPHEASALRSRRDGDDATKLWQGTARDNKQLYEMAKSFEMLLRAFDRLRRRGGGSSTSVSGMVHRGEWVSTTQYVEQNVVTRGNLGEFVAFATPPVGTPPEAGATYWHGWSTPPPGVWA